jgi:hypothetical protein
MDDQESHQIDLCEVVLHQESLVHLLSVDTGKSCSLKTMSSKLVKHFRTVNNPDLGNLHPSSTQQSEDTSQFNQRSQELYHAFIQRL